MSVLDPWIEVGDVPSIECDVCGFTMAAMHVADEGLLSTSCPCCFEAANFALLTVLRSPATQEALRTIYNRWTIYAKNPKYSQASREKWLLRAAALHRLLVEPVEEERDGSAE